MKQAREGDPDNPFTSALRQSYNDLEKQKNAALTAIAELDKAERSAGPKTAQAAERISDITSATEPKKLG